MPRFNISTVSVSRYEFAGALQSAREANWTPGGPDVVYMSRDILA